MDVCRLRIIYAPRGRVAVMFVEGGECGVDIVGLCDGTPHLHANDTKIAEVQEIRGTLILYDKGKSDLIMEIRVR